MDPEDFISLALKLSSGARQSELRTAISRAYYGAFHSARLLLEECGIRFPRKELLGADIHRKVRYCLAYAGNDDTAFIVNRLSSLREQRNRADYDLTSGQFALSHSDNIKTNVRGALEVIDALRRCRVEPDFHEIREKMRSYAQNVLQLPVSASE